MPPEEEWEWVEIDREDEMKEKEKEKELKVVQEKELEKEKEKEQEKDIEFTRVTRGKRKHDSSKLLAWLEGLAEYNDIIEPAFQHDWFFDEGHRRDGEERVLERVGGDGEGVGEGEGEGGWATDHP